MELEKIAQVITLIHAGFGGVALAAGGLALVFTKGTTAHKRSGKVFYYTMLFSALVAIVIAVLPDHESPFLFSIGVFSTYFLLSGYRSLNFKRAKFNVRVDKVLAYMIILTGVTMISYPLVLNGKLNIILCVFGAIGLIFGFRDLSIFKDSQRLRRDWKKLHLGKMLGGYIAAVSAFFVVNTVLPGIWNWFVPGIVGGVYIAYWIIKLNKQLPVAEV